LIQPFASYSGQRKDFTVIGAFILRDWLRISLRALSLAIHILVIGLIFDWTIFWNSLRISDMVAFIVFDIIRVDQTVLVSVEGKRVINMKFKLNKRIRSL
jgi:hypothetical protein